MRIDEYYDYTAKMNLNGSLLALLPAIFIIGGNVFLFHNKEIMILTVPFLVYSLFSFQVYLKKKQLSIMIEKNSHETDQSYNRPLLAAEKLVVFYSNSLSPRLLLFFPDGRLAGQLMKYRKGPGGFSKNEKAFVLIDYLNNHAGYFRIKGRERLEIEAYDHSHNYLGCFEKVKKDLIRNKKELLDASGRFVAKVEGAGYYMDEQAVNVNNRLICRLQRGFMPLEWSTHFPEANTPVFSFAQGIQEQDKLLHMAILINEFFLER